MRINRIEFEDYKLFTGKQEYVFDERLNLVEGGGGSGKTIMFNAIRDSLNASIPGITISIEGDAKQILEHSDLVFISGENLIEKDTIVKIVNSDDFIRVLKLFYEEHAAKNTVLGMKHLVLDQIFMYGYLDFDELYQHVLCMPLGEITLQIYLYFLKKREESGLELPIIIDRPFPVLDSGKRGFLAKLLKKHCHQVILLGHPEEFTFHNGTRLRGKYLPLRPETKVKR